MAYSVKQVESPRESSGEYRYLIFKGDDLVARYWHDHRGDDHGIEFVNGASEAWPVGRMIEFLEGGGPKPLTLSAKAIAYLDQKVR